MEPYWIDSNVLIDSANGPYTFSRVPGYWAFLDLMLSQGRLCTSEMVYRELVPYGDLLSNWVKNRKQNGLCVQLTTEVQTAYSVVANHISDCGRYDQANVGDFLSGADPWMIAHVLVSGGTLVTNETALRVDAKKARIPDVCSHFQVRCISGYSMLDETAAAF